MPHFSWSKKTELLSAQIEITKMDWSIKCKLYPGVEYYSIEKNLKRKEIMTNLDQKIKSIRVYLKLFEYKNDD